MDADFFALGLLWYVVFLLSTTCHEAAHSLAAKWGGDLTAFHGGQVTLNPLPHIRREPFGMVFFPIITYAVSHWMMGWASAPYDPVWSRHHPRAAAKMALAGPAANFSLAILAGILIRIGLMTHVFTLPSTIGFSSVADGQGFAEAGARFLSLLFSLNILLGTFNLLPLPPLDGFNALPIFMSEATGTRFHEAADSIRRYSFIGLLICWQIFNQLYSPIFWYCVNLLYS